MGKLMLVLKCTVYFGSPCEVAHIMEDKDKVHGGFSFPSISTGLRRIFYLCFCCIHGFETIVHEHTSHC